MDKTMKGKRMDKGKQLKAMGRLLHIMDELREKCPWDHKQTMESLRCNTIEETYELAGAVLENNMDEVRKELGDLLLHIVFYAKIGSEQGVFDFADVANGTKAAITAWDWVGLLLISFVLPAVLTGVIGWGFKKAKLFADEDLKLEV